MSTDLGPAIPATDIAAALGCTRKNITQIIKNNPHLFKGVSITSTLQTEGGPQAATCLTRDGVIGILMRVHPSGSKSEQGKDKIEKFQQWARDTLSKEMQIQSQLPQAHQADKAWSDTAGEHIRFARTIARELNLEEGMCLEVAIRQIEQETGKNLSQYRKLILPSPPAQASGIAAGPTRPEAQAPAGPAILDYLTPTEIAGILQLRADDINRYLCRTGYQVRENGEYLLTEKGSAYGKVFPFSARSGHNGHFLKWHRSIIKESKMLENRPVRIRES